MSPDLRFACRQLQKSPAFTLIAVATLAVGIGSATVVFSAVNALLFKPLPLLDYSADRLLYVAQTDPRRGDDDLGWSYPDYVGLRQRLTTLDGLWIHSDRTVILGHRLEPERRVGTDITWDAFSLMGVLPLYGRPFHASDARAGAPDVALISHELWQQRFGGDPAVINTSVPLSGRPVTLIGVMPPGWRYPEQTDVWTPLRADHEKLNARGYYAFSGRGRLRPGVTLAAAQAEADGIAAAFAREFPETNQGVGIKLRPIREETARNTTELMLLLFGAVVFVFLIACLNVANLLLAQVATRTKEVAIRLALGADRGRIVRQLITESLVLSLLGGLGGFILALWGNDALRALIPVELPFWLRFDFDARVFAFVLGLVVLAALAVGLFPALRASRPDVVTELKEGGRSAGAAGPRALRLRNALVVVEIALALVLLVGAGLMMRSFLALRRVDPGFDPRGVLTFRTGFPATMLAGQPDLPRRFFADLVPKLAGLPGVESVGLVSLLPGLAEGANALELEDRPAPARTLDLPQAHHRLATAGYFHAVRIPLLAGRLFDDATDRPGTPFAAVVDEAFARRHFGDPAAALGRRFRPHGDKDFALGWIQIVGVVGSIRHRLDRAELAPTFYLSLNQAPGQFLSVVMRTHTDPAGFTQAAREAVLAVNRQIPIYHALTLEAVVLRTIWPSRFFGYLFTFFGLAALFLACIGIYGVMAYNVTQRSQELGVRLALGAQSAEIIRLVLNRGVRLVGWGLGIGLLSALALANLLAGLLYGVSPHDPPTFAAVPLLLAAVALLACWLPGRRATRVNPLEAMRLG
ncbi:MAG: ABC transporter permease [Opitutaceae bacterium]|nr:ABC transporter permease [Opitutaceae bacterium]